MRYAAVLFDIDHTLLRDGHVETRVLTELLEEAGVTAPAPVVEGFLRAVRAGPLNIREGLARQLQAFRGDHPHIPLDTGALAEAFCRRCLRELPGLATVLPGVADTLAWLRESGVPTALVTNGWTDLQREKARMLGYDGPLFVSEDLLVWKPDPRIFLKALDALGVTPEQALYVGDNPVTDIQGSRNAGMAAAWIREDGAAFPEGLPRPQYTIDEVARLREALL